MIADMTIKEFLKETASSSPVPGGGSIAALSGALASALSLMVGGLTVGKKNYEAVEEDMKVVINKAEKYMEFFTEYIDKDSEGFNEVMKAFKLPKDTDSDKEVRSKAIQNATKHAAIVPLETAKKGCEMMDIIKIAVEKGNKNAESDGLVAAMMCRTAVLSALYNVKINLGSIKDQGFVDNTSKEVKELERLVRLKEEEILSLSSL